MGTSPFPRERHCVWPYHPSSLGSVRFGGVIRGGTGTSFSGFRRFDLYGLVYLFAGRGIYRDGAGREWPLSPGSVVTLLPGAAQQYGPTRERDWHEIYICFDGPAFEAWRSLPAGVACEQPVWSLHPVDTWLTRFLAVLDAPVSTALESRAHAAAVHVLLGDALAGRPPATSDRTWADQARRVLEEQPGEELSLGRAASALGCTVDTFRRRFRREVGCPPAAYRRRHRLAVAAELLAEGAASVEMAAYHVGFWDAAHFTHAFRREFGMNPGAWKSLRETAAEPRKTRKSAQTRRSPE